MKLHLVVLAAALTSSAFAAPAPTRSATGISGGLEERVSRMERMLESRNQVQLDMQQQLSDLESETSQLRGMLELHSHQIEQILARQRDIYQDIDRRLGAGATTSQASQPATVPASASTADSSNVAANVAYEAAFGLLKSKRYPEASAAFAKFVQNYASSHYAPNAYYWQAQLSYNSKDLVKAHTLFSKVISQYPKSNKRAESIFKLGLIAEQQGKASEAKQRFKQVVTEYPSSSVARLAKDKQ